MRPHRLRGEHHRRLVGIFAECGPLADPLGVASEGALGIDGGQRTAAASRSQALQSLRLGKPLAPMGSDDRVAQQAGDGHRTDAARNRRDRARHLCRFVKCNVAEQLAGPVRLFDALLMPTSMTVAPGLSQSAADQLGPADGGDDDVGCGGRRRAGRCVREWAMVTVQFACSSSCAIGLPTMFERPIDHRVLAARDRRASLQQDQAAERSAGHEARRGRSPGGRR